MLPELDLLSEDYEAVDHRLKLFLDVEVFEEEEEELHSFLKVSIKEAKTLPTPSPRKTFCPKGKNAVFVNTWLKKIGASLIIIIAGSFAHICCANEAEQRRRGKWMPALRLYRLGVFLWKSQAKEF